MYCHWRPPDAMLLLTKMVFEALGHHRPHFDGFIYIRYASPPYLARISASYLLPFGTVWLGSVCWLPCSKPGNDAQHRIYEGAQKLGSYFKTFVDQSSWNLKQCRRPLLLPNVLPDCLHHVSFTRYSVSKSSKTEQMQKIIGPQFSGKTTPTFLRRVVSAIYWPPFGNIWLSSVCWSPSAKPGNKVESRCKVGKWRCNLKPFVDQSSWHFETM